MGLSSSESAEDLPKKSMPRQILPLPKRRLRERLSQEAVESIKFPPAPSSTEPLFYYPHTGTEDTKTARPTEIQLPSGKQGVQEQDQRNYIARRNPEDADSDEDELAYRSRIYPRTPDPTGRAYRFVEKPDTARRPPQPPGSTTSSADDQEGFESTHSNNKKRKIPTPGDSGMNGSHLSGELAGMGLSSNSDDIHTRVDAGGGAGAYYSSPVSANNSGFSGAGRGRYGRNRNGRSPLRTLSDASSNWSSGRSSKRQPQSSSPGKSKGIISKAIADAEKLPVIPSQGQENVSLIQQEASKTSSPASKASEFTFTCDSQVTGTVTWPKPETTMGPTPSTMHHTPAAAARMSTHATQTSPGMTGLRGPHPIPATPQAAPAPPQASKNNGAAPDPIGKKTRRRNAAKEFKNAESQRRRQQNYQNIHHPPAREDIWICEFCEYEDIFGEPPVALIRQYEIKDRREKRKAEERRRLLEKAKVKGRKGKKGSKNAPAKNNGTTNPARQAEQPATQPAAVQPQSRSQSQGTHSDEYYEDDYEDGYEDGYNAAYNAAYNEQQEVPPPFSPSTSTEFPTPYEQIRPGSAPRSGQTGYSFVNRDEQKRPGSAHGSGDTGYVNRGPH